ncbi:uncharacterized protein HGUI_02440 [Hanseniaspora guilliermondii]|uniref:Peptidase A1 domain-containing protein n=1 Tax=Hanseniaspora guilliermondii TaxID=56406 RepID=A0A1L0B1D8_9ASCO|nr:uncharacterized protein HGUI_02440 [Hanseniaspora guilliermondii]
MKFYYTLIPSLASIITASNNENDKYVHYPVVKDVVINEQVFNNIEFVNNKRINKRDSDGDLQFVIENQQSYYSVNLVIGSNDQELSALLDTGSSDLWVLGVFGNNVSACDAYLSDAGYSKKKRDIPNDTKYNVPHHISPNIENDLGVDVQDNSNDKRAYSYDFSTYYYTYTGDSWSNPFSTYEVPSYDVPTFSYTETESYDGFLSSLYASKTGSSTNTASSAVQQEINEVESNCDDFGVFNPDKSSSFKKNSSASSFYIEYGDNTFASGIWGSDKLTINGISVDGMLFGVANVSNSSNVLGISFPQLESSNQASSDSADTFTYNNLPQLLKQQGLINKVAYSLYLNSLEATSGDLLFGAIDTTKYTGQLYTVPLINIYSKYYSHPIEFDITLQGTGYVSSSGKTSTFNTQNLPALLDSGTTLSYLPQTIANMFAAQVSASWDTNLQYYTLSCPSDSTAQNSAFVYQIGGVNYYVPLSNYILQTSDKDTCILGIQPQSSQYCIFGDNTLSSLYVVYDLEDYEISIAQADFSGASKSNIKVISDSIPGASKAPGYSNTWTGSLTKLTSESNSNALFNGSATNPWTKTSSVYFQSTSIDTHAMEGGEDDGSTATITSSTKSASSHQSSSESSTTKNSSNKKNNANAIELGSTNAAVGVFHALAVLLISLV